MSDTKTHYDALTGAAGVVELPQRTQVELQGKDRASFLHGFCTNDIKRLAPGSGCEAFLTSVQGRTQGLVNVFCLPESLVLETVPLQAADIIASLDKYLIREDVQLIDRSAEWSELLVGGPQAPGLLEQLLGQAVPATPLAHVSARLGESDLSLRCVDFIRPPCFFLSCPRDVLAACRQRLLEAGATACDEPALEILRIEAGTPVYGRDITVENLPQEVGRDKRAISFTKGCYLGQETVARIDALGHVNRHLRGLRFPGKEIPAAGTKVQAGGKAVGEVTSAAWSFRLDAPLALAYLRRDAQAAGTPLSSALGEVELVPLPV